MRRFLPLLFLLPLLAAASPARGDGCAAPCYVGASLTPPGSRLLAVRPNGEWGPLLAYDTATGTQLFALPAGVASADGRSYFTARTRRGETALARYDLKRGKNDRVGSVRGRWFAAAVSHSGHWLVLARGRPRRTGIAVVDTRRGDVVHVLTLKGNFEVETISADGERLFLIQYLRRGYQLRLYDLSRERLRADSLRRKGDDRVMVGSAWGSVASPDGRWLLTLYLNTTKNVAFIHRLDLERSRPLCIFLPSDRGTPGTLAKYTLVLARDGRTAYAANPALGVVAEVDLLKGRVVRTAGFTPSRAQPVTGPGATAPTGSATISNDGRTLYFSGGRSLWAYDTVSGRVRGPYRTRGPVIGLGFGPEGKRVYVVRADRQMLAFDAASGRLVTG
jgi:PQQ-like domain